MSGISMIVFRWRYYETWVCHLALWLIACSVDLLYSADDGAGEPGNPPSHHPGGASPGEVATEATEDLVAPNTPRKMQNKGGIMTLE